jgi:hypothetical protein
MNAVAGTTQQIKEVRPKSSGLTFHLLYSSVIYLQRLKQHFATVYYFNSRSTSSLSCLPQCSLKA